MSLGKIVDEKDILYDCGDKVAEFEWKGDYLEFYQIDDYLYMVVDDEIENYAKWEE